MATEQDDSDIPETGGIFTFGKSRFAENVPNKFWIRNDQVVQSACGDQHTVLFAESGRVFVFGDNSYGQLGLGNTKPQTKPSCVKALKGEQVSVIGCGAYHTLVSTSSGLLFAFGQNTDHQCALDTVGSVETPTEVNLDKPIQFTQLCGGSSHSVGLDRAGNVYVWGDNAEGQLGLGDDIEDIETPTKLPLNDKAVHIACGYYHTAVVTASGRLYTFGEEEGGKLGHTDRDSDSVPTQVDIKEKVVWVSCGGKHTAVVTAKGGVYTFGEGSSGQLGQGTNVMESHTPSLITYFKDIKIKYTSCGENFTAAISEKGGLYTFGDGRHGKLALGAENFSNQFRPFRVPRFAKFEVTEVSCGGCHTIALAQKRVGKDDDEEIQDPLNSTFANSMRLSLDGDLNASISARDRRRAKESPEPLSRTLPPLTSSTRGLPPLNSTYTTGKLGPLQSSALPNSLDKRKLPNARFSKDDDDEEDSNLSDSPEESADEEEQKSQTRKFLKNGKDKKLSKFDERGSDEVSVTPEDSEEEDKLPNRQSLKNQRLAMKKESEKMAVTKGKPSPAKRRSKNNLSPISDEEYKFTRRSSKDDKSVAAKNKKNKKKVLDSDEEADSALEESEEEPTPKSRSKKDLKADKKGSKKKSKQVSEEEEDSEEEAKTVKKKKSRLSIFGKNKKAAPSLDDDDDEDDEDEDEEEVRVQKSKAKAKGKDTKSKKTKRPVVSDEDEDDDEDKEEIGDTKKNEMKKETSENSKPEEKPPEEKKSRACTIL